MLHFVGVSVRDAFQVGLGTLELNRCELRSVMKESHGLFNVLSHDLRRGLRKIA
jgi:hypothetical protein